jgi:hypothetical protein
MLLIDLASFQEQQLKKQVNALQKEIGAKMKVSCSTLSPREVPSG